MTFKSLKCLYHLCARRLPKTIPPLHSYTFAAGRTRGTEGQVGVAQAQIIFQAIPVVPVRGKSMPLVG